MVEQRHIYFKVNKFSRFKRLFEQQRSSEPVLIQQLSWKIVVKREVGRQTKGHYLGCYVQCNAEDNRISYWNCVAYVVLQVQPRQSGIQSVQEKYEQQFNAGRNYCGNSRFLKMEKLLSTDSSWYSKAKDNIILEAIITAHPAQFQFYNLPLQPVAIPQNNSQTKTLANRMRDLLSNSKDADVRFFVGSGFGKEFSAHKVILRTVSDIFEQIFQSDVNIGCRSVRFVEVPDVTPEAFQVLLNYIYTEEMDGLNQDNVFDVIYTAKKYNVVSLFNGCLDRVKLRVDNVFSVFAQARLYNLKVLINRCWTFIDKHVHDVLATQDFLQVDQEFLVELLSRDQLKVAYSDEIKLWSAALLWADAQCHKHNIEVTGNNRRKMLGPALFNIRFPLIPREQFAIVIVPTCVLTKDEMISVLLYHAHPTNGVPSQFPLEFSYKFRAC